MFRSRFKYSRNEIELFPFFAGLAVFPFVYVTGKRNSVVEKEAYVSFKRYIDKYFEWSHSRNRQVCVCIKTFFSKQNQQKKGPLILD